MSNFQPSGFDSAPARRGFPATPAWLRALRCALPQACVLCTAASFDTLLCAACRAALPRVGPACPSCALPSPGDAVCGACLRRPPPQVATLAPWVYAFPVDRLVQALKYGGSTALAHPLADAIADALQARSGARPLPDVVVPLPLAPARQRSRGFNQAAELARAVGRSVGRPVGHLLARSGNAPPQAGLARRERERNVRGAFAACGPVAGLRIALVDDVITTGATLEEAARTLLRAGALTVEAWAVARALPPAQAANRVLS